MKPNLCLVISNLAGGGAQRVVSRLTFGLAEKYNLYLILHDGQKIHYPYRGEVIDLGTPVVKSASGKALNFLRRVVRLKRIKAELDPVAVISFMESSNFINLLSGRRGKTGISVRNYKSQQGRSPLGKIFQAAIRILYRRGDALIVPAAALQADLSDVFKINPARIKVIYNPFDLDWITKETQEPLAGELDQFFKGTVILTAGSLTRQKGHGHLLRVFREISKSRPDLKLAILGEGPLREYLEELISTYGLQDNVLLPGFQANPFQFMARADLFVLPSIFEGFPNVLVEAMACGLPVVAGDCPSGPREILAPGSDFLTRAEAVEFASCGVLCPVLSGELYRAEEPLLVAEKQLGEAILTLLNDHGLSAHYKEKGKKRAEDFASDRIVQEWVKVLEA